MSKKTKGEPTKPRQAMSARQVDRVEREIRIMLARLRFCMCRTCRATHRTCLAVRGRLERLLRMVQGSERR